MQLRKLSVERYKSYGERATIEIAPLTILVGANNSGKTALARAIHLLAGGLAVSDDDTAEPLPLNYKGVQHGESFADLVTGRSVHGKLSLSAELIHESDEVFFSITVQSVSSISRPSECQIQEWIIKSGSNLVKANRLSLDQESPYLVSASGVEPREDLISWQGVLPKEPLQLADWIDPQVDHIRKWAKGVRYLRCPRSFSPSRLVKGRLFSSMYKASGVTAPFLLVNDDNLRGSVEDWYHKAFGVRLYVRTQGRYSDLMVKSLDHETDVMLGQSGAGLSQVLPVVVTAFTADQVGPGVDIIEHPEAELHPASHAAVAELLLNNLCDSSRSTIIETHSEMILLRARRWIAEGRIDPDHVVVYWIDTKDKYGSVLKKLEIDEEGQMSSWPSGVFIEDYEEVLAIRRAVRNRRDYPNENRN